MKKIRHFWKNLTIKNKIRTFTSCVFIAILAALLFDVWVIKLFMMDFNDIMEDNSRSGEIITAINKEIDTFDSYVHGSDPSNNVEWLESVNETEKTLNKVTLDYSRLGEERYALLYSLKTAYSEYAKARDQVVADFKADTMYVSKLYNVYSMQKYLALYAQNYVDITMKEGNTEYLELLPVLISLKA